MRKHICEAIFSDFSDLIRDRWADTLFHLTRQSASNDYQYTDIAVTACWRTSYEGRSVTRSLLPLLLTFVVAVSHICRQADIDVTLRVVSSRQSSPVFISRSPVCRCRHSCFGDCYAINRWGRRSWLISRLHTAHHRQEIIKHEAILTYWGQ